MTKMPTKPKGAEKRLCFLTYSQIADWVGLESRSVQQYAARGDFDRKSLESVLAWVNGRRAAAGLPLIGQPESGVIVAKPDSGPFQGYTAIVGPVSHGGYNPMTGEFDA